MKIFRNRHGKTRKTAKIVAEDVTPWFVFSGVTGPDGKFQIRTRETDGDQYNLELDHTEALAMFYRLNDFFKWAGTNLKHDTK